MGDRYFSTSEQDSADRLLKLVFFLFTGGYLLQIFSPLRLTTDAIRLLTMAVSAYHGKGYLIGTQPDQFPIVYPFFIKTMLQLHLARSMTFILFNLFWLLVGLAIFHAWYKTQKGMPPTLLPITFVLSSWITIKHITLPMTDFLYFGVSSLSIFFLWLFWLQTGHRKWLAFSLSILLGYLALNCRSVGLTIFPVIAITAILHKDSAPVIKRLFTQKWYALTIGSALAALSLLAVYFVRQTDWYALQFARPGSYFQSLIGVSRRNGIGMFFLQNISYRTLEFGSIFMNMPTDKIPRLRPLLYFVGAVGWAGVLYGAWCLLHVKRLLPWPLYFLSYATLIFMWPYFDARFWLPLFPILVVLFLTAIRDLVNRRPVTHRAFQSYAVLFLIMGFIALLFSTKISLSGRRLGDLYGNERMRITYRYVLQNDKTVDKKKIIRQQVRLLQIFEPLARTGIPETENGQTARPANRPTPGVP